MKELTTALIKEQFNPPLNNRENQLLYQIEDLYQQINSLKRDNEILSWKVTHKTYTKLVTKDMLVEAMKEKYPDKTIFIVGEGFGPIIKMNNETYNTKDYSFDSMDKLVTHFADSSVIFFYELPYRGGLGEIKPEVNVFGIEPPKCEHCAKYTYIIRVYVKANVQETFPQCDEVSCIAKYVEKELGTMVANSPELGNNWGDPFDKTWRG
jgi:hypothetical protein